ncbi:hypothetical protein E1265_28070 [Streptomyces sp. 8K308]|uniref:hypothetical protein n=1 Tax=Streptomyces sp. 8K308 TaxID=2530388 RepID=UPI001050BD25|nr:hypothetical protein [Streptomyces sp. 8K308]TDC13420.1 hypothetical protein E1265_28070 [Streptomyces sp. 8K308]
MTGLEQLLGQELHRQRAADLERAAEEQRASRAARAARDEERRTGEAGEPASARGTGRRGRIAVA